MEVTFKHEGPNYVVKGTLEGRTMKISLATADRKFKKTFTFEEFPDEIQRAFDDVEDFFEIMEGSKNIVVQPFKGVIVLIVKTVKKNNLVEIPS